MKKHYTDLEREARQLEKEKILLKGLKFECSRLRRDNDPFNDAKLYSELVNDYFQAEWVEPTIDPDAKGRFRYVVETDLFGGTGKHLDAVLWDETKQKQRLSYS